MSAGSATLERAGSSSGDLTLRAWSLPVGAETTADHGSNRARGLLRTAYNPRRLAAVTSSATYAASH